MWHRSSRWAAAAVAAVGALSSCAGEDRAATCDTAFGERAEGDGFRSARPAAEARFRPPNTTGLIRDRQVFEQARAFRGDGDVLRLRWAAAHSITVEHSELGSVTDGAVLVAGATVETGTDESRVIKGGRIGALRVSDGKLLWNRSGILGAPWEAGETAKAAAKVRVALAEGPDGSYLLETGRTQPRSAGFNLHTGRRLWCLSAPDPTVMPEPVAPAGPGVAAAIFRPAEYGGTPKLGAFRSGDGTVLWSAALPEGSRYRRLVTGGGVAAVATAPDEPDVPGSVSPPVSSEFAGYRMSDGAKLWRKGDRVGPRRTEHRPVAISKGSVVVVEMSFDQSFPSPFPWDSPTGETRVVAYSAADGRLLWTHPIPAETDKDQVRVVGSRVLIAADTGVTALALSDGRTLWSRSSDQPPRVRDATVHGRYLYAPQKKDLPGLVVLDLERGTMRTTLGFLKDRFFDVAASDGALLVQYDHLTLAFDLPH